MSKGGLAKRTDKLTDRQILNQLALHHCMGLLGTSKALRTDKIKELTASEAIE
jgi:hypothetical protein